MLFILDPLKFRFSWCFVRSITGEWQRRISCHQLTHRVIFARSIVLLANPEARSMRFDTTQIWVDKQSIMVFSASANMPYSQFDSESVRTKTIKTRWSECEKYLHIIHFVFVLTASLSS